MPVSLGEWRVRIGTFMRRRGKEYGYNYFWRKLHNLIKQNKNAEPPKENDYPEYNISTRTGSSRDADSSPGNTARRPTSFYNVNLNTAQTGPSCDVNNSKCNADCQTRSQYYGPEFDTVTERGFPCDVNKPGHNDVSHSESTCAECNGSPKANDINPVPDTTDVQIPVPRPCVEDELDNRYITINRVSHAYPPNSAHIRRTDQHEVVTSESYSHVPVATAGETDRIQIDEEEKSNSAPPEKENQSSGLSPKSRQNTTRNTEQTTPSIREVTGNHGSPTYPVLGSGRTSGEADAIKGNDCPAIANILLLRSGDVERNPGPNDNLTDLELIHLAEGMDPSDFRNVGKALRFSDDSLSQFEKDKLCDPSQASYQMLYEWRKTVHDSEARGTLVETLESIKLVQLADGIRTGQFGDHIPSMTANEIQRVAEEVKRYYEIHLCQIQADPLNSELLVQLDRIFTNLTLMEEDKGTKCKKLLLYENLLTTQVNGFYPKRLLVEGEGGVGKTTFCAKIAWDWIKGKGYQHFKLVLVIPFREAKDKTVGEMVKTYLSDNNPVTAKQLDKHIFSNPDDDVFLVLDGLDESTIDLNSNQQIALITSNRLFNSGTVLITSRYWRSDEIRKNATLRKVFAFIAVEGFSEENRTSYITKFFYPDTATSEELIGFVSNNDVIRENMAPYPIYTAMLCIMWQEFGRDRRKAMSKLQTFYQTFNEMIEFLVEHYLSKHMPPSGIVESELRENRSDINHHLLQLGQIAFKGLLERRLLFTDEEFQSHLESIDVGCKVGVLTREKNVPTRHERRTNPNSAGQLVQFPHKLFQEYISGMYLASIYNSNRTEYDRLMANIITQAGEYRYLLYFTSAQQQEIGLDIVSRFTAWERERPHDDTIDDDFFVDVTYESQEQAVAKAVADHLSSNSSRPGSKTLNITKEMQAHTLSGHIFIMNHREVDDLIIEKSCGRTASEDLAEFMCSSRSLRSVTIASTMHDVFYSVLAKKAVDSKIETLHIETRDLSERPSASHDLAQFICKMPHLKSLILGKVHEVFLHDDFYLTSSSMASSAKIETLHIETRDLSKRPSASRDLAQFICKMPHLKSLILGKGHEVFLHDDFYSTSSSMASSAKIETLHIETRDLSERPSASRDLAQFICKMPHLKSLILGKGHEVFLHDDFYSTSSSMASSAKIETLHIETRDLSERPSASRDLAQFICKMPHLKSLILGKGHEVFLHDDFYSTSSSMTSSAKIETLKIPAWDLSERTSASRDIAQFICKMTLLKDLTVDGQYHNDFYSTISSMASSAKIETLHIPDWDLGERPSASSDLAQFICKMTHLKDLTLDGQYHEEFNSTLSSLASSAKIETLNICYEDLSQRSSASRYLAQFICKMPHLKNLSLGSQQHDDFYSTSSSMAPSAKIETLKIGIRDLRKRPSESRGLAQFICKMPHLKSLILDFSPHDDFYSKSSLMASSAKIETLHIEALDLSTRPSASHDLAQFICKMPHLKSLILDFVPHDVFYSTSSSMESFAKIETLKICYEDLSERPSASSNLAQFICKMPYLKNLTLGSRQHDYFYSTSSSSMASSAKISASRDLAQCMLKIPHLNKLIHSHSHEVFLHDDFYSTFSTMSLCAKSGNTSPTLTELTVDDVTLRGWQDCGSMFDNVKRVTIQVRWPINCDVIQMIHLPGATELTIQTHEYVHSPAGFHDDPTSLPNALLHISPQLVKVTFSDLDIGNSKMELILQAFRSPHNLKDLKIIRFIRCRTKESVDGVTIACNKDLVMEVEVVHGKSRGNISE